MNLYHISQSVNTGYDTYSDAVVAAEHAHLAQLIHPSGDGWPSRPRFHNEWCEPSEVKAVLIGVAVEGTQEGVICASYHAG